MPINGNKSGVMSQILSISKISSNVSASVVGWNKGISLGGPSSVTGEDTVGYRHLMYGITRNNIEGSPNPPSLELSHPTMWRFKWSVKPGQRRISVRVKQNDIISNQRPTLTIQKNIAVGIATDITLSADNSSDWVTIGPIVFTAINVGTVFIEIRNNLNISFQPLYIDHVVVS